MIFFEENGIRALPTLSLFVRMLQKIHSELSQTFDLYPLFFLFDLFKSFKLAFGTCVYRALIQTSFMMKYNIFQKRFKTIFDVKNPTNFGSKFKNAVNAGIVPKKMTELQFLEFFDCSQALPCQLWGQSDLNDQINEAIRIKFYPSGKFEFCDLDIYSLVAEIPFRVFLDICEGLTSFGLSIVILKRLFESFLPS